jgi:hypothetical protein
MGGQKLRENQSYLDAIPSQYLYSYYTNIAHPISSSSGFTIMEK